MTISPAPKCNHDQNSADSATKKDEEKEPKNEMHVIIEGDEPKGDVEGGIQQKSSSPVADAKNPEPIPDANGNIDAAFIRIPYEYPFVPAYNGDAKSTGKLPEPSAEEEKPAEPPASPEKNAAENKENYDYDADSEALTKMLLEAIGTEDVGGRLADQLVKENDLQKNANGEGEEKGEKEMKMDAEKNDDDLINLQ